MNGVYVSGPQNVFVDRAKYCSQYPEISRPHDDALHKGIPNTRTHIQHTSMCK